MLFFNTVCCLSELIYLGIEFTTILNKQFSSNIPHKFIPNYNASTSSTLFKYFQTIFKIPHQKQTSRKRTRCVHRKKITLDYVKLEQFCEQQSYSNKIKNYKNVYTNGILCQSTLQKQRKDIDFAILKLKNGLNTKRLKIY